MPVIQVKTLCQVILSRATMSGWTVPQVWLAADPAPDTFVDVTDHFDRKLAALRAHTSQTGHLADLEQMLRGWGRRVAETAGLPDGRLAEAWRAIATG